MLNLLNTFLFYVYLHIIMSGCLLACTLMVLCSARLTVSDTGMELAACVRVGPRQGRHAKTRAGSGCDGPWVTHPIAASE